MFQLYMAMFSLSLRGLRGLSRIDLEKLRVQEGRCRKFLVSTLILPAQMKPSGGKKIDPREQSFEVPCGVLALAPGRLRSPFFASFGKTYRCHLFNSLEK